MSIFNQTEQQKKNSEAVNEFIKKFEEWKKNKSKRKPSNIPTKDLILYTQQYNKLWRERNKEYKRQRDQEYYKNNSEKIRERALKWKKENRARHHASVKLWMKLHPDKKREWQRRYQNGKGREAQTNSTKRWRHNNKEHFNKQQRERINSNPALKLRRNISSIIASKLRSRNINMRKDAHTTKIIGCEISFLKSHLEARFVEGMTWNNYGSFWTIDHIIPCNYFIKRGNPEIYVCHNYRNLRPMLFKENIRKYNHLPLDHEELLANLRKEVYGESNKEEGKV